MTPEETLRKQARSIFDAAWQAADPFEAVLRHLRVEGDFLLVGNRRYRLFDVNRIYVVGAGKASALMAKAVEHLLPEWIQAGLINVKYGHTTELQRVELNECGHPVPDANGVRGAERIARLASQAGEKDLVICLISGGASALLPLPASPVTLGQKQETTRLLLSSGANIHEINAVRKHLSRIKGGQLARLAYPATVIGLLLSDVIGDDLDVIGSGPTAPDPATFQTAKFILEKNRIWDRVPASVRERIEQGVRGQIPETPKSGDAAFARSQNVVVGSNKLAVEAAAACAKEMGFNTMILSTFVEGETREVARVHAAIAKEIRHSGRPLAPPACIITGGETTVTVRGDGLGGRNQEFALAAALDIAGLEGVLILSGGTDGTDGPTDAAGALANGLTLARGEQMGLSGRHALANNDSYPYFQALGDLLFTGPTNTNVMDVRLILVANR